ncbi:PilN domain-containing protein [Desulfosporosinus hippei]|uniref:Type IV pilus assembly protein PilN n=1 Tax=Desulfosporosinus hippei DSM 8344 TaxID=1121419 RepID=A0A1G8GCW0_9FIRM|nr:PilN domain-containing protein [Desulfosporosinus hippei]SDH92204.1 type IV pilus assembly protein PilN [Desulfosporosinus hippei DSM 8344]
MKDINLILKTQQQKRERQNSGMSQKFGIAVIAVLVLGLFGYGILTFLHTRLEKKELAIEQKIAEAAPVVELKKNISAKQEKINKLSGMVDLVASQSTINTRIFEGISSVMPESVFIVNYSVSQTGEFNIIGKAKDMDSIAYFVHELKGNGLFSDVYLSNVSDTTSKNTETRVEPEYNFSVLLTLKK